MPHEEYPKYGDSLPVLEMETEQVDRVNHVQTISNTCTCKEREEEGTGEETHEHCLIEF